MPIKVKLQISKVQYVGRHHLKLSPHRNKKSSDFDEFGTQQQIWNSTTVT